MAPPTGPGAVVTRDAPRTTRAPRPRPRLELVRPTRRLRPGLIGTAALTLLFSTLFVLAAMQAVLVQGQLRLDQLDRDIKARQAEVAKLSNDVATMQAPEHVQRAAADHGLVDPPDVVFLEPATVAPLDPPSSPTGRGTVEG